MRDVVALGAQAAEFDGMSDVGNFAIAANAKAFKILIANLYSNKPLAIVRELWSNARDSHAAAGILDRPFESHLPVQWEPHFSVRDFGVSLTHEQIVGSNGKAGLYTTIFESTKEDENTSVGKFGLGSKTPFAYGDSFTVTAILAGEKRVYTAFLDRGMPRIALASREPTDEEQGLQVDFPIEPHDVQAFQAAARRVALGFDVLPTNNIDLEKPELEVLFEGAGWRLCKRDYQSGLNGIVVRQGCVLYPVDVSAATAKHHSLSANALRNETLILEMPIGSVDIAPSREALSYDDTTCKNLIDRIDGILDEFIAKANDSIKNAATILDAMKARSNILSEIHNDELKDLITKKITWRGRPVLKTLPVTDDRIATLGRKGVDLLKVHSEGHRRSKTRYNIITQHSLFGIDPTDRFLLCYYNGDTPKHLSRRLAKVMERPDARHHNVFVLPRFKLGSYQHKLVHVTFGRPTSDQVEFIDLDSIHVERVDYGRTLAQLKVWDSRGDRFDQGRAPGIEQANVYYVHTLRNEPVERSGNTVIREHGNYALSRVWDKLKRLGLIADSSVLVGIPASRKDIANNIPEAWEEFWDFARDVVRNVFDVEAAARQSAAAALRGDPWNGFLKDLGEVCVHILSRDSLAIEVTTKVLARDNEKGTHQLAMQELVNDTSLFHSKEAEEMLAGFNPDQHQEDFRTLTGSFAETYPLAETLMRAGIVTRTANKEAVFRQITDYINVIDRTRGEEMDTAWG